MADLGAIGEIVNSGELSLEVGSDEYVMLTDLIVHIGYTETRKPTTSGGTVYTLGKGNHWMTFTLTLTTPELSSLNGFVGTDSNGQANSYTRAWKVVVKDVSAATKTLACTGYLRDYDMKKNGVESSVDIDCFVRITGNDLTIT